MKSLMPTNARPVRPAVHAPACSRANSMNCLTEVLGLSLPGNGSILATHADRRDLFLRAGRLSPSKSPNATTSRATAASCRVSIASFEAFENADDPGRGHGAVRPTPCCTCWLQQPKPACRSRWLTLTASRVAYRAFPRLHRPSPTCTWKTCTVPAVSMGILGELDRAGLLNRNCPTVHTRTLGEAIEKYGRCTNPG